MSLRVQIEEKYKEAVKSKDIDTINTLRLIKSALKDKDIENRRGNTKAGISDVQILSMLQTLIKQRRDSIESFKVGSRNDLVKKEELEIELIKIFLPQQLNEEETQKIVENVVKEKNFTSLKDMGSLMNILKSYHAGSIDMAKAGKIAKSILSI